MAVNKSYVRPHTEVYQFLDQAVESTGQHLTACIIGSQYDLYRVGKEDITPTPVPETISGDTISVAYTYDKDPLLSYDVDKGSFQVVCSEVLLDMVGSALTQACSAQTDNYSKVIFTSDSEQQIISSDDPSDLPESFGGYSIEVGDVLEISNGSSFTTKCRVKELVLKDGETNKYVGVILDSAPVDLSQSDLTLTCTLKRILKQYSGLATVTASDTSSVTVSKNITIEIGGVAKTTTLYGGAGTLTPEFRVRVIPPADEDVITIQTVEEIQEQLGTIDVQNEIAYAAYCALKGSQGREVYVIRLRSEDVEGYTEALKKTDADSYPYTFVPILDGTGKYDREIIETIVAYIDEKSQPDVQMWRTVLIGVDREGEYEVKFSGQGAASATVYFAPSYQGESPVTLCQISGSDYSFNSVDVNGAEGKMSPGDFIEYNGTKYQIKEILADNLARLVAGPATKTTAAGIKLIKASSATNHRDYLHGLSDSIKNRRGVVVWCDKGTYEGTVIPCAYLAAEIAGIQSAVLPQQSITMTEIQSITAAPRMYTRYTQKQLDEIASGGILIVTQDNKYGVPYIRHQLTTDNMHGSLYSEMSITKNLDNISYAVADLIKGYCGRANVTTTALPHLKQALIAKLTEFTQDSVDDLVGPSLVRFYDLTVQQDPKHMDRVLVNVTYELPLPMNNIKVYQMVYAATVQMDSNN